MNKKSQTNDNKIHMNKKKPLKIDNADSSFKLAYEKSKDTLELKYNGKDLPQIPEFPTSNFSPLKVIDLANNKLYELSNLIIFSNSVHTLKLNENLIHEIPEFIELFRNLTTINLSSNMIQRLPKEFVSLVNLKTLDLCNNLLQEIDGKILTNYDYLTHLNLSHNKLEKLPEEIYSVSTLHLLDVSYNKIKKISSKIEKLQLLETLNLSHNEIRKVPFSVTYLEQNLKVLTLLNNPICNLPASIIKGGFLKNQVLAYCEQRSKVPIDIHKLEFSGEGSKNGTVELEKNFFIQTYDLEGKELNCGGENILVQVFLFKDGKKTLLNTTTIEDCSDGKYKVKYEAGVSGKYTLEFTVNKIKSDVKPLDLELVPDVCHECVFDYDEISKCIVDKENNFVIKTLDRFGNFQTKGGQEITAIIKVPPTPCKIVDNNNGTYLLKFTPTSLGSHFVEVNYQKKLIKGCPIRIRVFESGTVFKENVRASRNIFSNPKRLSQSNFLALSSNNSVKKETNNNIFEWSNRMDFLLNNSKRMREKCYLTTELSSLDKKAQTISEKAHITNEDKDHLEKLSSYARKHHNLQDFHRKYSDKAIFNTKSNLIYVKQNLEVVSPLLSGFDKMTNLYRNQLQGVSELWPVLQTFNINKKFDNLKSKEETINYKSISDYLEWSNWFESAMMPTVKKVNDLMKQLSDALEEEEELRKVHFEKIDQTKLITQNAIIAIQEYKKKGNLEIERLSLAKKCSKLIKIYYETVELSFLIFKRELNSKFYKRKQTSALSRIIDENSNLQNSNQLTLSQYFLIENDSDFEKMNFRSTRVHLAVNKSSLKNIKRKKMRNSSTEKPVNVYDDKSDVIDKSNEQEQLMIKKSEKFLLYVYQYLSNKVLLFFHHQISLLQQVKSHPLVRSISNFGYDKITFTLFVEVPRSYYSPDKEKYLCLSEWKQTMKPTKQTIFSVMKSLFQALSYLHARQVVHGNLNESCIFVNKKDNVPYITNFEILNDKAGISWENNEKSPPELVSQEPSTYGPLCDIWNLSVLFFELYYECDFDMKYVSENDITPPKNFSDKDSFFDSLNDLFSRLLCIDPRFRITSFEALLHPFFNQSNHNFYQYVSRYTNFTINIKIWEIKEIINSFSNLTTENLYSRLEIVFPGQKKNNADRMPLHGCSIYIFYNKFFALLKKIGIFEKKRDDSLGNYLPSSNANPNYLTVIGKIFAKAILDGMTMDDMKLSPSFFRFMLGENYCFSDLECYDPILAVKLIELMVFPVKKSLFYNSSWIDVNNQKLGEHNKASFFEQRIRDTLLEERKTQMENFKNGFQFILDLVGPTDTFRLMSLYYENLYLNTQSVVENLHFILHPPLKALKSNDLDQNNTPPTKRKEISVYEKKFTEFLTKTSSSNLKLFLFCSLRQPLLPHDGIEQNDQNPCAKIQIHFYDESKLDLSEVKRFKHINSFVLCSRVNFSTKLLSQDFDKTVLDVISNPKESL